jgi:glycosyltransferase involved in cell wall biosynthesis
MRVLIFSITYFPFVGGAEVAVKEITDRINDIEFDMITARMDGNLPKFEKIGNINVYRIGWGSILDKYLFPLFGFFAALSLNRKRKYDLIHSIMASRAGAAAFLFKLFHSKVPLLLTLQEGDAPEYMRRRAGIFYPFYKSFFKKVDYIQAISQYLADYARKMGARCPIQVVPNGVDLKRFTIHDLRFKNYEFRKKLGIKEDEKVVITASRLVEKNAIDDLIKAIYQLTINSQQLTIKLLILGEGKLEEKLKLQVTRYKLQDNILFLGQINHQDLPQYLAIADVFVRPSLSEGLGSSFLEAMACGVPVIATPVGGIPDFLEDKETGLFCQRRNPESVAQAIIKILTDNSLRERIIQNSLKLVKEKYNWDKISQEFRSLFYSLEKKFS